MSYTGGEREKKKKNKSVPASTITITIHRNRYRGSHEFAKGSMIPENLSTNLTFVFFFFFFDLSEGLPYKYLPNSWNFYIEINLSIYYIYERKKKYIYTCWACTNRFHLEIITKSQFLRCVLPSLHVLSESNNIWGKNMGTYGPGSSILIYHMDNDLFDFSNAYTHAYIYIK